ncbi:hypothetical protein PDJAM_G00171790, partial [Pangasius djambal]|nr:hypothetical protein [Pangasius djambal]
MKLTVIRFRSGSIITDMSLRYTYQGDLPSDQQIIDTIKNADTGFNMTDVFVTQTATTTTLTIPTTIANISSATTKPFDTTATTKSPTVTTANTKTTITAATTTKPTVLTTTTKTPTKPTAVTTKA